MFEQIAKVLQRVTSVRWRSNMSLKPMGYLYKQNRCKIPKSGRRAALMWCTVYWERLLWTFNH